ncbi:hypothetical protein FRE64_00890 [Euhalothece natronophila Z-M001]|uniref:DUF4148 domain-containing protein n=1 Tax=Euhalothece natronophila Z-M001 TaxID=522448 RepID=A0A5B8NHE5_9CHRO|nr:hypothetical protein [Euhalothece natronophila]QDZ38623.1 hypothetical protein FRE64_00890 [Euhalothece natronophila Z-M001]
MRRLILTGLSSLFVTLGVTPVAIAEATTTSEQVTNNHQQNNVRDTEAFSLVSSAYRGDLTEEGIPAYAQFEQAYIAGEIDAESLVNSAIEAGHLSSEAIEDEAYLAAVTLHLDNLAGQSPTR